MPSSAAYDLLGLQTYFTAGKQEVRAWTVRKGAKGPEAAGVIHTDFEKGFIRAEVMKYDITCNLRMTRNAFRSAVGLGGATLYQVRRMGSSQPLRQILSAFAAREVAV